MVVVFEGLFLRFYWITWNVSRASPFLSYLIFVLARPRVGAPSGAEPRGERQLLRAGAEDGL